MVSAGFATVRVSKRRQESNSRMPEWVAKSYRNGPCSIALVEAVMTRTARLAISKTLCSRFTAVTLRSSLAIIANLRVSFQDARCLF
jgi:hypothetical protein